MEQPHLQWHLNGHGHIETSTEQKVRTASAKDGVDGADTDEVQHEVR